MDSRLTELLTALHDMNIRAELTADRDAVNVWDDQHARVPATTVYPPDAATSWAWGDSFEWRADDTDDGWTVANKVLQSFHQN